MSEQLQNILSSFIIQIGKDVVRIETFFDDIVTENGEVELDSLISFREECEGMKYLLQEIERHFSKVRSRLEAEGTSAHGGRVALSPSSAKSSVEDSKSCSICLDGPPNPCNWNTICGHTFHRRCIENYFDSSPETVGCPICRVPIVEEDFSPNQVHNEDTNEILMKCRASVDRAYRAFRRCKRWIRTLIRLSSFVIDQCEAGHNETEELRQLYDEVKASQFCEVRIAIDETVKLMNIYQGLREGMSRAETEELFGKVQLAYEPEMHRSVTPSKCKCCEASKCIDSS